MSHCGLPWLEHENFENLMKIFNQTFKDVPQKKIWNALKKLFFAFLTSMLKLKKSMSANEAPFMTKRAKWSYHKEIQVKE